MSGLVLGLLTTEWWKPVETVGGQRRNDLPVTETCATSGNPLPTSTMTSLPGLQVVVESHGSQDRAGRHTWLSNASCARTTEIDCGA